MLHVKDARMEINASCQHDIAIAPATWPWQTSGLLLRRRIGLNDKHIHV